jgi:hypothetical protein
LGVRLTTYPCKKKFVENLTRKENTKRYQGSYLVCGAADVEDYDDFSYRMYLCNSTPGNRITTNAL